MSAKTILRVEAGAPPLATRTLCAGEVIAGAYSISGLLGEGGMGTVYLAHHSRWDLDLVLKVPKAEILQDPDHSRRVTTEAEAWTDLGMHPHLAYCYHVHLVEGVPLLVVEYVDGGNLREWIAQGRCADLATALDLAIQFCHGMEHAHARGLVHRDLKPENVLMQADGTLKVTDFGIARTGAGNRRAPG